MMSNRKFAMLRWTAFKVCELSTWLTMLTLKAANERSDEMRKLSHREAMLKNLQ